MQIEKCRRKIGVRFHSQLLPNGLQIIGETSPSARSVALGFFVRTGSRDETAQVSGVTHFLEHMVFKGTPRRSADDVNRDFDRIGAHYNAYTSEENTVFYAAILPEYLPQAVDLLADILRPSLRVEDFDMEKNVIIEEIGMYEDQPMWSAYDHAKRVYFAEHPAVLGAGRSGPGGLGGRQLPRVPGGRLVLRLVQLRAGPDAEEPGRRPRAAPPAATGRRDRGGTAAGQEQGAVARGPRQRAA